MDVLVPVDGSECSERALDFGVELAECFDGSIHVVHFTDRETDATEQIIDRAEERLAASPLTDDPELVRRGVDIRRADNVGDEIIALVGEEGYDHVVMGHHGSGRVERAILGSAAETVLRSEAVPVTILP